MAILLGIGNPLLDISVTVDDAFYSKYELKESDAILAEEKHMEIFTEIKGKNPEFIAGGACQNSIRGAQWMLQQAGATAYVGCVGKDENAATIKNAVSKDGVTVHYLEDNEAPTGTCAALIKGKERSLVTNIAAANNYKKDHFLSADIQSVVAGVKAFYATGFFLTVSPETLIEIGTHCVSNNKPFLFNLSAPFLIDFFFDQMKSVLPYTDVVFSNEDEAAAFGKKNGWGEDLNEIAKKLAEWPKENAQRKRMIVFTQGSKATIVYHEDKIETFTPLLCAEEDIVDLNGAGDSFVGGFLSQFVNGQETSKCVEAGHYLAYQIIRTSGTKFTGVPEFK